MANIRVSAAVTTVLTVATTAAVAGISASVPYITATAAPVNPIRVTAFVVPMEYLTEQTVTMSDFRAFNISQVSIDVCLATDDVALSFVKVLTDEVTANDASFRAINSSVDFDPGDADADPDPITVVDTNAKGFAKVLTDASVVSETDVKSIGKAASDSVTSSEAINTKHVGKTLTDAPTVTDEVNTFAVARVSTDAVTAADTNAKDFTLGTVFDTVSGSDAEIKFIQPAYSDGVTASDVLNAFNIGRNPSDSVTATEAQVFTYDKVMSDTVSITDVVVKTPAYEFDYDTLDADADPDPVSVSDTTAFAASAVKTDSVTGSDSAVLAANKTLADSVSATDVIDTLLTLGESNALYDFAFMSDDKFTYFPVMGTMNSHLIHQPLVNGEFVLTTDPNAGIVYTIRTESTSYMYAGYGLNENQLN